MKKSQQFYGIMFVWLIDTMPHLNLWTSNLSKRTEFF